MSQEEQEQGSDCITWIEENINYGMTGIVVFTQLCVSETGPVKNTTLPTFHIFQRYKQIFFSLGLSILSLTSQLFPNIGA